MKERHLKGRAGEYKATDRVSAAACLCLIFFALLAPHAVAQSVPKSGWTASCDSAQTGVENGACANAIDGNASTYWLTAWSPAIAPLPHQIQVDMGSSSAGLALTSFSYQTRTINQNSRILQYEFYLSNNPANFGSAVATGTFNYTSASDTTLKTVTFPATTGRFFRLRALSEASAWQWVSAAEISLGYTLAAPTASTNGATGVSASGATLNGTVLSNGASTAVSFEYGLTTSYGSVVSATPSPLALTAPQTAVSAILSGLACATTYHFRVKATNSQGTRYGNDFTFTTSACSPCPPPTNVPAGLTVTCQCDSFNRTALNPSTIFGSNWTLSYSDGIGNPYIKDPGFLRLTDGTQNNAKAATVPGVFPAAGNYISVEFQQYAYDHGAGSAAADGMAVVLSDSSISPTPGAFGGSLGYAQKTTINGFAGGWLGVGLDEYGSYARGTEGRSGGPVDGIGQAVGLRGSGSGTTGYGWLGGAGNLTGVNAIGNWTSSRGYGYYYQVIVDARTPANTMIAVNRDTSKTGNSYSALIPAMNIYAQASANGFTQAPVPANWKISFTGSTGSFTNIHEIGGVRICATNIVPPGGESASGFSVIDEAYPAVPVAPSYADFKTGHIYMKLAGVPFQLWVAALRGSPSTAIASDYSAGTAKYAQVKLVDNSDGACGTNGSRNCSNACTGKAAVETGATRIATFVKDGGTGVASPSPQFTLNSAYTNLVAVVKECTSEACSAFTSTAAACSADLFSVRPHALKLTTNATATTSSATPVFKAGGDVFTLNVDAATYNLGAIGVPQTLATHSGYTGSPRLGAIDTTPMGPGSWVLGALTPATLAAAVAGVSSNTLTYSELGLFKLAGYWPKSAGHGAGDDTSPRGVYDDSWTGVDSPATVNDCLQGSYSNLKVSGKYGCNFGLVSDTTFGRFIPDHFTVIGSVANACVSGSSGTTYMGQPFVLSRAGDTAKAEVVEARNRHEALTQNYAGAYARGTVIFGAENADNGSDVASRLAFYNAAASEAGWNPLAGGWVAGIYTLTGNATAVAFKRPTSAADASWGAFDALDLGLTVSDADLTSSPMVSGANMNPGVAGGSGFSYAKFIGSPLTLRYGRVRMLNANGSSLLDLKMPMRVEYWNSLAAGWQVNSADRCTDATLGFSDPRQGFDMSRTCAWDSGTAPGNSGQGCALPAAAEKQYKEAGGFAGDFNLWLKAPYMGGSLLVTASVPAWLQFNWIGTTLSNPSARASFDIAKSGRIIHRREMY